MKKLITTLILPGLLATMATQCPEDDGTITPCQYISCQDETLTERLIDVEGEIIRMSGIDNLPAEMGGVIYGIQLDAQYFGQPGYTITDDILVPCEELPDEFKEHNLRVLVSGNRKSCCRLLSLPNLLSGFGCKLELTAIRRKITND
ncbi:MAG: hypothetical protein HC880_00015 [Bacteroidia bacterium]|nr:hypothetical protein [Bacteroidia bacterium]